MRKTTFTVENILLDITDDERRKLITQKMERIINKLVKDNMEKDVKTIKS